MDGGPSSESAPLVGGAPGDGKAREGKREHKHHHRGTGEGGERRRKRERDPNRPKKPKAYV